MAEQVQQAGPAAHGSIPHPMVTGAVLAHVQAELATPSGAVLALAASLQSEAAALADAGTRCADIAALGRVARRLSAVVAALRDPDGDLSAAAEDGPAALRAALHQSLYRPVETMRGYAALLREDAAAQLLAPTVEGLIAACDRLLWAVEAVTRFATEPACMAAITGFPSDGRGIGYIVLIDADADGRALLERRLGGLGHRVRAGADDVAALSAAADETIDLILVDIAVADGGTDVLCRLRGRTSLRGVPVVAIAADPDSAGRAIAAGAEDCLIKPLDGALLGVRLAAWIERKRLRDMERAYLDRLQWELTTARRLQGSALPRVFPRAAGLDGYGLTLPAREVGGDFFDFMPLAGGRIAVAIGDVSGRGVPAAFLMGIVRGLLRMAAGLDMAPGACLTRLNQLLGEGNDLAMFVTAVYGVIDPRTRTLTYANAGHNPPLLSSADGGCRLLPATGGPALAAFDAATYEDQVTTLDDGDMLVLYTDGMVEARDVGGACFGNDRLCATVGRLRPASPQAMVEGLIEEVRVFAAGQPLVDDIACAAILAGPGGPAAAQRPGLDLRFRAQPDEVMRLLRIVDSFCLGHGLSRRLAYHLALILDEAVTNIISYAYDHDPKWEEIGVRLELGDDAVRVEISDRGRPFDPRQVPPPPRGLPVDEIALGGLGIHIIRSLADSLDYRRTNDTNKLIMVKRIDIESIPEAG